MFDSDVEWWRVEARRGHGPHGASRRRARSPAERVRARPEVDLMINRGRGGMVNAGVVSEGCSKVYDSTSGVLQTQVGDRLKQHAAFQGRPRLKPALPPARAPIEGSARDPQPPTAIAPTGTKPRRSVVVCRP